MPATFAQTRPLPDPALALGPALRRAGQGLFLAVLVFSTLVNLLMLTGPLFMMQVYDRVLASQSHATLIALFGLTAFLYAAMVILDHARALLVSRIGARLVRDLEQPVFLAALRLHARRPGDPLARVATQDLDTLQRWLASPLFLALFDAPWTPAFVALIWIFHPALGMTALAGGAALVALAVLNQAMVRSRLAAAAEAGQAADRFAAALRAEASVVTALGMTGPGLARWRALREAALVTAMSGSDRAGFFSAATRGMRLFLQSLMLAVGAWLVLAGELGAGAMIAASIIMGRALAPVEVAVGQWGSVQSARLAWRRLGQVLSSLPAEHSRLTLPRPRGDLLVQDLTVVPPGEGRAVLRDVSFALPAGRMLGVTGPSGAGKSSLARALVGAWPPLSGAVRLDGLSLDAFDPRLLGPCLGYLPQKVVLLNGTVAENIARLDPDATPESVIAAARAAGAHDTIMGLSQGYDTRVGGEGGDALSGGQMQRIGLARALFGDPVLVVLDEPDAHLDSAGLRALADTLRHLRGRAATAIIIAHRPEALTGCDTLLSLEGGHVTAFGPVAHPLRMGTARFDPAQAPGGAPPLKHTAGLSGPASPATSPVPRQGIPLSRGPGDGPPDTTFPASSAHRSEAGP